ncbi:MAG: FAD:protein FMN transferase [Bacteroidota bacterium]
MFRLIFFTISFCLITVSGIAQQKRFTYSEEKMGSPFTIIFYSNDSLIANEIAGKAFLLVDSMVTIFSDYIDSSELNRLCARAGSGSPVVVSPSLFDIILKSKIAYEKSQGTFDITLGPLTKLWRNARKNKLFPTDKMVKEKRILTGFNKVKVDTVTKTVELTVGGMQLDLGGIAQGYIAQKVIDFLQLNKLNNALVDVSGDITTIGKPPGTEGWTIGVNIPGDAEALLTRQLLVSNKTVTTSGDLFQFMEYNNKRYSHIIDPRTGYGITVQKNVTVIADDGTIADWLTKACSLLSKQKAKKLVRSVNAELLVVTRKKTKLGYFSSKGFKQHWKSNKL